MEIIDGCRLRPRRCRRASAAARFASAATRRGRGGPPGRRASILVAGDPRDTTEFGSALLERLCKAGYQSACSTRAATPRSRPPWFRHARPTRPPWTRCSPRSRSRTCRPSSASRRSPERRPGVRRKLLVPLRDLRARTGRPHWILVDEAHDLLPARDRRGFAQRRRGKHDLRDADPAALSPASSPRWTASSPAAARGDTDRDLRERPVRGASPACRSAPPRGRGAGVFSARRNVRSPWSTSRA